MLVDVVCVRLEIAPRYHMISPPFSIFPELLREETRAVARWYCGVLAVEPEMRSFSCVDSLSGCPWPV